MQEGQFDGWEPHNSGTSEITNEDKVRGLKRQDGSFQIRVSVVTADATVSRRSGRASSPNG
jgi:hypothetical protein